MAKSGIYVIVNTNNNKKYVGSACNFVDRKRRHFRELARGDHPNNHMQRSFEKHGEAAFRFFIVEYVSDRSRLLEREQFWIDLLDTYRVGYNATAIAGSHLGVKRSEKTKKLMSEVQRARKYKFSDESKAKMAAAKLGKKASAETRAKMSAQRMGNKHRLGGIVTEETRRKLSEASAGNKSALGVMQSEETKRKRADSIRATCAKRKAERGLSLAQL